MRDIMTHTYASHVLRSFLEALGGVPVKEEVVRSRVSRNQRKGIYNFIKCRNILKFSTLVSIVEVSLDFLQI